MTAIGRLKAGVTLEQARREMGSLAMGDNREKYQAPRVTAVVTPLAEVVLGPARPTLLALLVGTGLALLVACANVAALQLVQVEEGAPEIALRAALGASRARLVRAFALGATLLTVAATAVAPAPGHRSLRESLLGGVSTLAPGRSLLLSALVAVEAGPPERRYPRTAGQRDQVDALLVAVGGLAAALPARRALRVDPATTLREP